MEQFSPLRNRLCGTCRDRIRMDGTKTRTSGGKTLSSGRTAPLKPKSGLSGPPVSDSIFFQTLNRDTEPSGSAEASIFAYSNSRPHWKQTLYVRCLMVNTRLSWRCRHRKTNSKTHSSGFIRPALACVQDSHSHPTTRAGRERWPEPAQWSSPQLRSRC